ncbi:DUF4157 domain-containing protein [Prevotella koreensis]|uniref:DUF4157 domain-containing protein n=2 Tax=Prevotella koreensis TaxID=2490854 RepID=A0A3S0R965_9BACT|nr:DUF4157 domain-containing protein [Prevotella koreensis]
MPSGLQNMMENGFGRDFSQVRLHTDSDAVTISSSIQAKAFTLGNDIYFNQGQYSPESSEGQKLVAHELTHVIQENRKVGRLEEQVVIEPFNRIALDDKITDICNNVKAKITIYNAEIQKPVLNRNRMVLDLFRNSYKENVDSTSSTPNTVFINNIKNLLEVLEKNVNKLKISTIGIDKTRQDGSVVFAETIIDNMKIDHEIICYNGFLNQNLENRAFTIIHEFSHMYMNANDDCYWSVAETAEDYCGKMSDTSKESVASAIEYFVKKVYYGDFRKPNVPNVPLGTKKEFDIGSKISPQ